MNYRSSVIFRILKKIRLGYLRILGTINPILLAKVLYYKVHKTSMNLDNPKNLDEKINWMKFYSDTSPWSILADKYKVRDFIISKGLSTTLNDIYGIWDNSDDIQFNLLPSSFVFKTTNGSSGVQVMIVKDKSSLDMDKTKKILNRWLKYNNPFFLAEPHYLKIKPQIIAEKLLIDSNNRSSLIDYKFHCFNGHVESILVCTDRIDGHAYKAIYTLDWEILPNALRNTKIMNISIARPKSLDLMIEYSQILSKGFPYVRVDWYEINNNPVFSELTFTPAGGYNTTMNIEYLNYLGSLLELPVKINS